ncbi:MAG: hypothetical protein KQ78_00818 [Candidatus Izimaplasma bacterium HR2]|nr:MAG: hypothetical protein KQ78_00818 [Candidatus Izimaplasma bacterium HR2]
MEYLFYLIPGIINIKLFRYFRKTIPKEQEVLAQTIDLIISSVTVYFFSLVFLIVRFKIDYQDGLVTSLQNLKILEYITNEEIIIIASLLIVPSILTLGVYLLASLISGKMNNTSLGSNAYIEYFTKTSEYKVEGDNKTYSFPVKIFHEDKPITKGRMISKYSLPWEFKEVFVENDEKLDFKKLEKVYTYYDFESKIKYEIFTNDEKGENDVK